MGRKKKVEETCCSCPAVTTTKPAPVRAKKAKASEFSEDDVTL